MRFTKIHHKLITILSLVVLLIITLISTTYYMSTKQELIKDIKTNKLLPYLEASQSDIHNLLGSAFETVSILSRDPAIIEWFYNGETDEELGKLVKDKLTSISKIDIYFTVSAVSDITKNYWTNGGKLLDIVSEDDPDDSWFFNFKKSGLPFVLNIDYNQELKKTLIFSDGKIEHNGKFIGTTAVGINAQTLVDDLKKRKITANSTLMLIAKDGTIKVAQNNEDIGKNISQLIGNNILDTIVNSKTKGIVSNIDINSLKYELAYMKIGKMDYYVVMTVPINELLVMLNSIKKNTIIVAIISLLITMLIVYFTSKSLTKPLVTLAKLTTNVSKGKLSDTISDTLLNSKDELADLGKAFKSMKNNLQRIISQVKDSSEKVKCASDTLDETAKDLSNQSMKQASSTQEISSTVEEISMAIEHNAKNTQLSETVIENIKENSISGKTSMDEAIMAMQNIYEHIDMVEDIANKTNMLALNAAVEAARAGEHGKGFAVVASEIRKLAEHSKNAAVKIREISQNGVTTTKQTGIIFTQLAPNVKKSRTLIKEIKTASDEQNQGAKQIYQTIVDLDLLSQNNANAAETLKSQIEQIMKEIQNLNDAIAFFEIN